MMSKMSRFIGIRKASHGMIRSSVKPKPTISRAENLLLSLSIFAVLLPTAPQAILTVVLVSMLGFRRFFAWKRSTSLLSARQALLDFFTLPLSIGVAIAALSTLLVVLLPVGADGTSLSVLVEEHLRLAGKQGVWGLGLLFCYRDALHRGWNPLRTLYYFVIFLGFLLIYCVLQRYTGIDWVHGLQASLPPNRYAYGVYRVSAFMGHPLTLAYNLMLVALLFYGLLRWTLPNLTINRRLSAVGLGLSLAILWLSASRWPIAVTAGLILLSELCFFIRRWWKYRFSIGGMALIAVLGAGIFLSTQGRFSEVFHDDRDWVERVPRLVFWQVHGAMFMDHPWFGVGYTERNPAAMEYYAKLGYDDWERKYSAHNMYLQTLADSGLLGFFGLAALLFGIAGFAWRLRLRFGSLTGVLLLSGIVLAGLMQNHMRDSEFLFAVWALIALILVIHRVDRIEPGSQIKDYQPGKDTADHPTHV